jgi:signal transduction histidine kinase
MTRKPVLLHQSAESGAPEVCPPDGQSQSRNTGTYIALAGVSVAVAALLGSRKPKPPELPRLTNSESPDVDSDLLSELAKIPGWDLLFESNSSAMLVCDLSTGRILTSNHQFLELSGFDRRGNLALSDLLTGEIDKICLSEEHKLQLRTRKGGLIPVRVNRTALPLARQALTILSLSPIFPAETRINAFSALSYRLSSARTQREAIQIILNTADQFFGWDACTFDHYSAQTNLVHPVIVIDRIKGERRDVEPVVANTAPTARMRHVIKGGAQLILRRPPLKMAPDSVPMGDQSKPSASIMWVPVRSRDQVIGLLSIHSYKLGAYSSEDLHMLQALADQGAGALDRIQAEEQVRALNVHLENRVQERTAALQDAVRELEAFSYSISHDMRAPLRAMEGYTRKLLEEYPGKILDRDGTDYLSRISRGAMRLDMLIQDVLTYTNVSRCDAPLTEVNLEILLQDLIATYPDWRAPNVTIEIVSPLPKVIANEALLTQCISHLVDNALKFVSSERAPHVRISAQTIGNKVRTCIEDNGPGIAEKDHARVFRLFEKIHPTSDFAGTGVGLTIVKKAVERMNGAVGYSSELGKGSTFWFELAPPCPV